MHRLLVVSEIVTEGYYDGSHVCALIPLLCEELGEDGPEISQEDELAERLDAVAGDVDVSVAQLVQLWRKAVGEICG